MFKEIKKATRFLDCFGMKFQIF